MRTLEKTIDEAERLWWDGKIDQAISLLQPRLDAQGFAPRGAVLLAYLLRAGGDLLGAVAQARIALRDDPLNLPAWEILLFADLDKPAFDDHAPGFLAALRSPGPIHRPGISRVLVLTLLRQAPPDAVEIARRAVDGKTLTETDVALVETAMAFLSDLAAALDRLPAPPTSWSLAVLGGDQALRMTGAHCQVDLSWFRHLPEELGWTAEQVRALAAAIAKRLPIDRFRDREANMISDPALRRADRLPAAMNALIVEWFLARTSDDPDVRLAGRRLHISQGDLVLRAGRVELWALISYMRNRPVALDAAEASARRAEAALQAGEALADRTPYWPRDNPEANVTFLTTNAGWYAPEATAAACFDDWSRRYLAALRQSRLLVETAEILQRLAVHAPSLRNRPLHDWDDASFFTAVDGRRVVLATPFWQEIDALWQNGALTALWRAAGIRATLAELTCVPTPMSIFPHRPDADWSASYARLSLACRTAISASRAEVFLASCGCYGLPIVHAMHKRFPGITGIYFGHAIHVLFGILTNYSIGRSLHLLAPDAPQWCRVNLDKRYPGIAKIDKGAYVIGAEV